MSEQKTSEPLAHQGYEGETSVAREARAQREAFVCDAPTSNDIYKSAADVINAGYGRTPDKPAAISRCAVAGCTNHAGAGLMRPVLVCMPCETMLTSGQPGSGTTFVHLLNEALLQKKRLERFDLANKLVRDAAKKRGTSLSSMGFDIAMDAVVAALSRGENTGGVYGQITQGREDHAGVQSR